MGDRFYKAQEAYQRIFNKELKDIGLKSDLIKMLIALDPELQEKSLAKQLKPALYIELINMEKQIMAWTQEQKDDVIKAYLDAGPTAENSTEIIKQLAEDHEQSPNGIRMILVQAGVYVKKEAATAASSAGKAATGDGTKRVSKESQIESLRKAITDAGAELNEEVIEKLTGKSAAYFASVITSIAK